MTTPMDAGTTPSETPTSDRITFEQWLTAIEDYRDKDCQISAEWLKVVKDKKYKTAWKAAETAFEEWKANPDIWNGANGPDIHSLRDVKESAPSDAELIARGYIRDEQDPKLWVQVNVPLGKDPQSIRIESFYDRVMKGFDFTANIMGHPFRAAFMEWVMQETTREGGYLKRKLAEYAAMDKSHKELHYDLFRAEMLEAFGQDLLGDSKQNTSRLFGKNGKLGQYNNKFITQLSDGSWQTLSEADVAQLLQSKDGPNIEITANHAYGETLNDLTPITEGYKKLTKCSTFNGFTQLLPKQGEKLGDVLPIVDPETATDAEKAIPFSIKPKDKDREIPYKDRAKIAYQRMLNAEHEDGVTRGVNMATYDKRPFAKGQTLLIAAVQTRENNFLNLAQLFHRLYDIDMANKNGTSATDTFEHCAPIARTMVYTLLKAIAQDSSQIVLDDTVHPPRFDVGSTPIKLRPDATEILGKAIFFGFSKGGNDYRDGLRLLARTLNEQRDGQPVFAPSVGTLKDIVGSVSVTAQSMNEKVMNEYYENLGVDTSYFINTNDEIAMPDEGMSYRPNDRVMGYNGRTEDGGHHPDVIIENLGQNPYILQFHRCVCAALNQHPAIRFVEYAKFDYAPRAVLSEDNTPITYGAPVKLDRPRYGLTITTEPGTTDEMFEGAISKIQQTFNANGLGQLRIGKIPGVHGASRYEIFSTTTVNPDGTARNDNGETDLLTRGMMQKLADVFYSVNGDKTNGVVSSTSVAYPMLSVLGKDLVKAQQGYPNEVDANGNLVWKQKLLESFSGHKVHAFNMGQFGKLLEAGPDYTVGPDIVDNGRVEEASPKQAATAAK